MKRGLVLFALVAISLLLVSTITIAFGQEVIRGKDYIITQTIIDDTIHHTWQSAPEWIFDGANYQAYIYQENPNWIMIETAHGSVMLNKNTCGFSFFKKGHIELGDEPLFTDSIIARMAINGTDNWTEIDSINNANCHGSWNGSDLVATKASNAGVLNYKYIDTGKQWKTELEAGNHSPLNDRKFGFTQTIDLNRDTVNFAGQQRNIDDFNGTTFGRTFLENNEADVIDLLNNFKFDLDLAFENLWSVYIEDTGINKSKLAFDFTHNAPVILSSQTLLIDPTFQATGTEYKSARGSTSGAVCVDEDYTTDGSDELKESWQSSSTNPTCQVMAWEWDISSIVDNAVINNVNVTINLTDGFVQSSPDESCSIRAMQYQPSVMGAGTIDLWNDITNGTTYHGADTWCDDASGNYEFDLGSTADTDLDSNLGVDWFAVGIHSDLARHGSTSVDASLDVDLKVDYDIPVGAITDLDCNLNSDPNDFSIDCDWSAPIGSGISGYQIQRDSGLGFETILNDTKLTNTFFNDTSIVNREEFTITYWTKTNSDAIDAHIQKTEKPWAGYGGFSIIRGQANDDIIFKISDGTNDWIVYSQSNTMPANDYWQFIGVGYDGSGSRAGMEIWSNGTSNINGTADTTMNNWRNGYPLIIGMDSDHGTRLTGQIDKLKIWNEKLTGSQINDLYNDNSISADLWGEWNFENNLNDSTDREMHGYMIEGSDNYVSGHGGGSAITFSNDAGIMLPNPSTFNNTVGSWYRYNVTAWGTLGQGTSSNIENVTAVVPITASPITISDVIGDVIKYNFNATISSFPNHNVTTIETFVNDTLSETANLGIANTTISTNDSYIEIGGNTTLKHRMTVENFLGDPFTFNSTQQNMTLDYMPDFFLADTPSLGHVNFTINTDDPDNRQLKINRPFDNATDSWTANCKVVTGLNDENLAWYNNTNIGAFKEVMTADSGQNLYIKCYNPDDPLFGTISYGNLTGILSGFSGFDNQLGSWFGLPMIFMFVFFVAGLFGGRQSGTSIVIVLAVIAILGGIGLIAIEETIWGIMLVLGALGLFASRVRF